MATYNEDFDGTSQALSAKDATWVYVAGDGDVYFGPVGDGNGGILGSGSGATSIYRYNNTVGADQYAEVVIANVGVLYDYACLGVLVVRSSTDASPNEDHYRLLIHDQAASGGTVNFDIVKVTNGTPAAALLNFTATLTNGDTIRLEATGTSTTSFVVKRNGSQIGTTGTDSSSAFTSGQVGVGGAKAGGIRFVSWAGGDISSGSSILPMVHYHNQLRK